MVILENRRALFEYEILEKFEAGMGLYGWEVKSVRARTANLRPAWVKFHKGEVFLENFQVAPWPYTTGEQPRGREKKLLLNKREIGRLEQKIKEKGFTVVPLKIFEKNKKLKCEIAVVKGRKKYEKRQVLKDRAMEKEAKKTMKQWAVDNYGSD